MGNQDLIVIVNTKAFLIKGTEYEMRHQAVQQAIAKFEDYMNEIDKSRYNPGTQELWEDADPDWFPEDIETIRIYAI